MRWHCINLPHRLDRKERITGELRERGIDPVFEPGIYLPGNSLQIAAKACAIAHYQIMLREQNGIFVILEDDALPTFNHCPDFSKFPNGVIALGCLPTKTIDAGRFVIMRGNWYGTHAILFKNVSPNFVKAFGDFLMDCSRPEPVYSRAAKEAGTEMLRTKETLFTTFPSLSDRTLSISPTRDYIYAGSAN